MSSGRSFRPRIIWSDGTEVSTKSDGQTLKAQPAGIIPNTLWLIRSGGETSPETGRQDCPSLLSFSSG